MTIKKKIISGFLISTTVIVLLAVFNYINFIEIRKEIRNLEFTDTIRSKSLQLRRHEKNFFLLNPGESNHEWNEIQRYLKEINDTLQDQKEMNREDIERFKSSIDKYKEIFDSIKRDFHQISMDLNTAKKGQDYETIKPLIMATILEQPSTISDFLIQRRIFLPDDIIIKRLKKLHKNIQVLRKLGVDIIFVSKDLDRVARNRIENIIFFSSITMLIVFPLFLLIGLGVLLVITGSIVNRLKLLSSVVESTGKGEFKRIDSVISDEVGILMKKFNEMEEELIKRDEELRKKSEELFQSKKLAAIGSLAAGVAHELNNPLNNIYISAQVLKKEAKDMSPYILEIVDDIMTQSSRVKHIVSDLLEFARGREPHRREVDIREIILGSYKLISASRNTQGIDFCLQAPDEPFIVRVDPQQFERVFINLFNNAIDAMKEDRKLIVTLKKVDSSIIIDVTDTGIGVPLELIDRIFEPFYSTKQKGTGLGLAIVYNIIKKHGGDIFVQSEVGRGTTFTIKLE